MRDERPANRFSASIKNNLAWPLMVVMLTLAAAYFIFGAYLYAPNKYVYAFGGDALVIYYDMIFHTCYDKGPMLMAMNYPYGEYIYLTDAQGAIAMVLQWINRNLFEVCDYIPGIIHALNIYLLPVCSLLIFYILKYFRVREAIALVFSILITLLSPQMLRFGGHFGLAYPFVIPMVILWFLRKYNLQKFEIRDVVVLGLLLFFTYNNPYVGFSAAGFLMCAGFILALFSIKNRQYLKPAILAIGLGFLAVLIPFLDFKINDPVDDRIKQQWGHFAFHASLKGLLYPPDSLIYRLLSSLNIKMPPIQFESSINIGLVGVLLSIGILWNLFRNKVVKKENEKSLEFPVETGILAAAALILFLYADSSLFKIDKDWAEEKLGPLLMFKASGRIAWSTYYIIAISAIIFLDRLLKNIRKPIFYYLILFIAIAIWSFEISQYVATRYRLKQYESCFLPGKRQEMIDVIEKNNINLSEFQAMLIVPRLMAWSDNFLSFMHWESQYYGMRFSAATGLPMINAMLSRMSTGHTAEAIQMLSNPLIRRERLDKLPNRKDILLLSGANHPPLDKGEQFLLDIAEPLYQSEKFSLYRLKITDIENNHFTQAAREIHAQKNAPSKDMVHYSFDEENSPVSFFGKGAKSIHKGATTVFEDYIPTLSDTQYVFSAWTKIDHKKYGIGDWKISVMDCLGQTTFEGNIETRRSNDIQDMWIRSELTFPVQKGSKVKAVINSNRDLYIDEVLIYPIGSKVLIDQPESDEFMLNGFKVEKSSGR